MFRKVQNSDKETVIAMAKSYYLEDGNSYGETRIEKAIASILAGEPLAKLWIIEQERTVIGYLCVSLGFSLETGGRDFFIDELFVKKTYRNQGIGTKALEFACAESKKLGAERIVLEVEQSNPGAKALYKRFGFESHPRYLMSKFL
ncbi:GNAT family N-acetyltransferase [Kiloniella litopenaei]|uniref:GNAT family N-acetyltransferase n=1 Tax=Kiloniella litopenaei TaxID=1549748 RepID=UPI000695D7F4|nr:GNAT family N-acetyltransferase [Kiloniella litopenaei]